MARVLDQRELRMRRLFVGLHDAGIDEGHRHAWAARALGVQSLQSFRGLTSEQIGRLIDHLEYPPMEGVRRGAAPAASTRRDMESSRAATRTLRPSDRSPAAEC